LKGIAGGPGKEANNQGKYTTRPKSTGCEILFPIIECGLGDGDVINIAATIHCTALNPSASGRPGLVGRGVGLLREASGHQRRLRYQVRRGRKVENPLDRMQD
jgi:hypothetical protein